LLADKDKAEAARDRAYDTRDSIERRLLCEVRDLREALERAEAELLDLRERYAHVNAEYEAMMAGRIRLKTELASCDITNRDLHALNDKARQRVKDLEAELADAKKHDYTYTEREKGPRGGCNVNEWTVKGGQDAKTNPKP
jgi:predicted nuclease with TOPRIM domain